MIYAPVQLFCTFPRFSAPPRFPRIRAYRRVVVSHWGSCVERFRGASMQLSHQPPLVQYALGARRGLSVDSHAFETDGISDARICHPQDAHAS